LSDSFCYFSVAAAATTTLIIVEGREL